MRMLPRSRRLAVLTTAVVTAIALTLVPGAQATKGKSQGKGQSAPVASDTLLYRGATTVALDPDTAAALTSLGVSVAPTKPAKAGKNGISFPITLGVVDSTTLSGQIRHAGGLVFSKGETEVYLSRFFIDTDAMPAPVLSGLVGAAKYTGDRAALFNVDLSEADIAPGKRSIRISGVKLTLTAGAADALNGAFGTDALTEGFPIGTATVRARTWVVPTWGW